MIKSSFIPLLDISLINNSGPSARNFRLFLPPKIVKLIVFYFRKLKTNQNDTCQE